MKGKSTGQRIFVNGEWKAGSGQMGNYTVYVNPYLVLKSGGYTKHYYIESQRIVSKLGGGWDNKNAVKAGGNKVDYVGKTQKVFDGIVKNLKFLGADGQILTAGKSGKVPPGQISGSGNVAEPFRYFYHPDHLGSTSYVTDATGEVYQHLEYFAFGETFVEEHSNTDRTPYLFNGKELDEETGLYYYGARYYDPRTSVFISIDPLTEEYSSFSPYVYAANNPIRYVDVRGEGPGDGDGVEPPRIIRRSEWGAKKADEKKSYKKIEGSLKANYNTVTVHHSGNADNNPTVSDVQEEHMRDGMADIGYHFAIDLDGNIYEGRPLDRQGAHVKPNEEHKNEIGIVLLADLSHDNAGLKSAAKAIEDYLTGSSDATPEMVESLVKLVRYLRQEYGIEYFGGHLEANSSGKNGERYCPGNEGIKLVQQIRQTFKFHKPGK